MFSNRGDKSISDLSAELNDEADWQAGILKTFTYHLDICAFAFEPVARLLAIGTTKGEIEIFGAPGVHIRLSVNDGARVSLLHFSVSLSRLLCIDEIQRLYVWDLITPGKPRLQKILNYKHPVTALAVSPSHQHAFIGLANGEVQTYDLLCSRASPYSIPNMWHLYESKLRASSIVEPDSDETVSQIPVDLVTHPRDLNLLFVVYGGGVILSDLTQRSTVRAYVLELPPGAPGGGGYYSKDLLTSRKPSVTAFSVHPSGHFFAVGYADGTIGFWALEDEDKPLLVRTLDEDDVHVVDGNKLGEMLSTKAPPASPSREPIFKLVWSGFPNSADPRGGETVLTVLGGLNNDEPPGVISFLLPAYNPAEPPNPAPLVNGVHPFFREAMRQSLFPTDIYTYFTKGVTQDFLVVPRSSPHFSGTWDPASIILTSEYTGGTRGIEAHQFPPPSFAPRPEKSGAERSQTQTGVESGDEADVLSQELASALDLMQDAGDPKQLALPSGLWSGLCGITKGHVEILEKDAYEAFVDQRDVEPEDTLSLTGGVAWVEDFQGEMKLVKLQPHRIFVTIHPDLSIRFQDLSPHILVSSSNSPLDHPFPNPLPFLTINLTSAISDPAIATRVSPQFLEEAVIESVHFSTDSLECAAILKTGEVILYRLTRSRGQSTPQDKELIPLHHIPARPSNRFRPAFAILTGKGPVTAFALSDVGFSAVAYSDGSLLIIDMRGPKVLLNYSPGVKADKMSFLHRKDHANPFISLTWAVGGTAADPTHRVLLLATHTSGSSSVYGVIRSHTGTWAVKDQPEPAEATPNPLPGGSVVIDAKTGVRSKANRSGLASVMAPSPGEGGTRKTIWVSAGAKSVRCIVDITGERIARADWGSKVVIDRVEVVHKDGAAVLVALTEERQALIYSLPFLELLHTVQLGQTSSDPLVVDSTGDYIELVRNPSSGLVSATRYGTLFNIRRSGPYENPTVSLRSENRTIPPQPQPVSLGPTSYISSWLGYITSQGMTGEQVDALLAGPGRPVAQPTPKGRVSAQDASEEATSNGRSTSPANSYAGIASSAANAAGSLYSRLGTALQERGEHLGQLQESFDSLEQGTKRMLDRTKNLAAQQTAKRWFGF